MQLGTLKILPAAEHLDKVAKPVAEMLLSGVVPIDQVGVAVIDPTLADTAAFCEHYQIPLNNAVNCVVVQAERAGETWLAAALVLAHTRADVNGVLRKHLGARKLSFASMERALAETNMEFGGITPVGLPHEWPICIDSAIATTDLVVIGGGIRGSKLVLPGSVLRSLPNVAVLEGLGVIRE